MALMSAASLFSQQCVVEACCYSAQQIEMAWR